MSPILVWHDPLSEVGVVFAADDALVGLGDEVVLSRLALRPPLRFEVEPDCQGVLADTAGQALLHVPLGMLGVCHAQLLAVRGFQVGVRVQRTFSDGVQVTFGRLVGVGLTSFLAWNCGN